MRLNHNLAKKFLSRVEHRKAFWFNAKFHVYSLEELANGLNKIDSKTFEFHLNRHKNDFEPWIRHVIGDEALANIISRVRAKNTLIRKLKERIAKLKEYAKDS
jgi:hypothetical protein